MSQALSKSSAAQEPRRCCISLGVDGPSPHDHPDPIYQDFSSGLQFIKRDLQMVGFSGETMLWDQCYPASSPLQQSAHGAFKPFCFWDAYIQGYNVILWLDASIRIHSQLEPVFKLLEEDGYLIFCEDHSLGAYCKDDALARLGLDRESSFHLPSCWSCVLGLDLRNVVSRRFLYEWRQRALDGITFPGPKWSGTKGWPRTASDDLRVKGHRHDQTAASAIALTLNMRKWHDKTLFGQFFTNQRESVRLYQEDRVELPCINTSPTSLSVSPHRADTQ